MLQTMAASDKNLLLDKIAIACNRATHLHALCSRLGQAESAAAAARRRERLQLEANHLLGNYYAHWNGDLREARQLLDAANKTLDGYLQDIENRIDLAESIAKAGVVLDGAIGIAAKLAG